MTEKHDKPIPFLPYPVAAGSEYGYRMFNGERWVDCDKHGNLKERRAPA